MNIKKFLKIFLIFLSIFACVLFLYIKKEPVNQQDLLPFVKVVLLIVLSYFLKISIKEENFNTDLNRLEFWGILAYKLCYFLCGIIIFNHSITFYHQHLIWKFLVLFIFGMLFFIYFFYMFLNDNNGVRIINKINYKEQSFLYVLFKIIISLGFAFLGVFFVKSNKTILATITYFFLIIQLIMIFRVKSINIESSFIDLKQKNFNYNIIKKIFAFLMFIVSLFCYYFSLIDLQNYNIYLTLIYFILGSLFLSIIILLSNNTFETINQPDNKKLFDLIYSVFIFILSIIIFSWRLLDVPPGVHGDETLTVKMAKKLANGEVFPVILEADAYNGMGILFYWFIGMTGKLFGQNLINARGLSILVGALGIVFTYLLIKEIFNRRIAIIASIFQSVFFMQIFYSRMAMQWIWVPAFATAAYYFFFKGLKSGKPLFYILSGLILSVNLGFYSAAKVSPFPIIIFIIILFLFRNKRQYLISNWQGIFILFLALLLTFLPVIDYMIYFPDKYFKRMGYVRLLQHFPVNFIEWQILITNILKNIQMFFTESAIGYCHNLPSKPFLDGYSGFLVILGLGYLFVTWKRERSLFIILWLFFGLLPGFLSHLGPEDPYPARTVLSIPAIIITLALGLDTIINVLENLNKKIFKFISPLIIICFFIFFAFYNLRNYFIVFPKDPHTLGYYRYIDKLNYDYITKNKNKYLFILSPFFTWNYYFDVFEDFSPERFNQYIFIEDVSLFELYKLFNSKNKDISINAEGIYYRMFPIYKEYFPDTKIDIIWDTNCWEFDKSSSIKYCYEWKYPDKTIDLNNEYEWFYMYDPMVRFVKIVRAEITSKDINNTFTLKAEFYKNNKIIEEKNIRLPVSIDNTDFDKVVIRGLIDIPEYGIYEFLSNLPGTNLYVDEVKINKPVELYKGLHKIKFISEKSEKSINLKWKYNKMENFKEIENKYFINSDKIFGLLATYKLDGKLIYKELQPVVDFRIYFTKTRPAYKIAEPKEFEMEWYGYIDIKEDDVYNFKLHNLNDAKIIIDDKVVFVKEESKEKIIPVKLSKGKKKIKIIRYKNYKDYDWFLAHAIRFMYKKSNWKEYAPVSYNMLYLN